MHSLPRPPTPRPSAGPTTFTALARASNLQRIAENAASEQSANVVAIAENRNVAQAVQYATAIPPNFTCPFSLNPLHFTPLPSVHILPFRGPNGTILWRLHHGSREMMRWALSTAADGLYAAACQFHPLESGHNHFQRSISSEALVRIGLPHPPIPPLAYLGHPLREVGPSAEALLQDWRMAQETLREMLSWRERAIEANRSRRAGWDFAIRVSRTDLPVLARVVAGPPPPRLAIEFVSARSPTPPSALASTTIHSIAPSSVTAVAGSVQARVIDLDSASSDSDSDSNSDHSTRSSRSSIGEPPAAATTASRDRNPVTDVTTLEEQARPILEPLAHRVIDTYVSKPEFSERLTDLVMDRISEELDAEIEAVATIHASIDELRREVRQLREREAARLRSARVATVGRSPTHRGRIPAGTGPTTRSQAAAMMEL